MSLVATVHPSSNPLGASLGTLGAATARSLRRAFKNVGSGTVTAPRNTADALLLTPGRYVRFTLDGNVRQVIRIVGRSQNTIDDGEAASQTRTVSGGGLPSLLGDARVVAPVNVYGWRADTRYFNFASPDYPHESDPAWINATELYDYGDPTGYGPGIPADWPVKAYGAKWIWSRAAAFADPPMPVGEIPLRAQFTLADDADVRFYITADDGYELWVDGELLSETVQAFNWRSTFSEARYCVAGTHHVAIKATNLDRAISVTNFAGLIFAAITQTGGGVDDDVVLVSDSSWICQDYPAMMPGWNVPAILDVLMSEAQLRGALVPWSWTFTTDLDSDGNAWSGGTISPAVRIGTRYDELLVQLGAWACDWSVDYDTIELQLYPLGALSGASGVALAEGGNVQSMSHDEETTSGTDLYGRLADNSYFWDTNGGDPRIEMYAELGSASTVNDGSVQADALFDDLGSATKITATLAPVAGVEPWTDFDEGESVVVDDMDGTPGTATVDAITITGRPSSDDGVVGGSVTTVLELSLL